MARQINKPLVFGLLGALVVVLLAGGTFIYLQARKSHQLDYHREKLTAAREKGDVQQELLELMLLTQLDPENEATLEEYARLQESTGKLGEALRSWRQLVDKDPDNIMARTKLAEFAGMSSDFPEMGRQAQEILRRDAKNPKAHQFMAQSYLGRNLLAEAAVEAEQAVQLDPKNVRAYITWAQVLGARNDDKKAEEVIKNGMTAVPDSVDLQMYAGEWFRSKGDLDKAEEAYKAGIAAATQKVGPLMRLADLYSMQEKKQDEAEAKYKEAVQLAETGIEKLSVRRAHAKYLGGREKFDEALKEYEEALAVSPNNPAVLLERAGLLMRMGRLDDRSGPVNVEKDIAKVLERTAHDEYLVQALYLQGGLKLRKGETDDAIKSLEQAKDENLGLPRQMGTSDITVALAQCYEAKGDTAKAKDLLTKALSERPGDWRIRLMLGQVQEMRGEYDKAVNTLSGGKLPVEGALLMARVQTEKKDFEAARSTLKGLLQQIPDEVRALLEQVRVEYAAGEYKRAEALADEMLKGTLLKTDADRMVIFRMKILVLTREEKYVEVEKAYQKLIADSPKDYETKRQYAAFLLTRDRFADGEKVVKEIMATSDKPQTTSGYLAWYYTAANKLDLARAEYRRMAEQYPESAGIKEQLVKMALSDKDFAEARKYQQDLKALKPDDRSVDVLGARVLMGEKRDEEAARVLQDVVRKDARDPEARYFLALAQIATGQVNEAVTSLETVVVLAPRFRRAQELLANLYFEMGQVDKSEQMLRMLSETSQTTVPEEERDRLDKLRSMVEVATGRPAEAEKKLLEYLKDHQNDGASWMSLGDAQFAMSQESQDKGDKALSAKQSAEAEKAYMMGWGKGQQNRRSLFVITRYYLVTNRTEKAIELAEKATSAEGGSPGPLKEDVPTLGLLARLYDRAGRQGDEEKIYVRIEKIDPGNVMGLLNKAERLAREGKQEEATAVLEDASKRVPGDVEIRRRLAASLVAQKKFERAMTVVDEGLARPGDALTTLGLNDLKASVIVNKSQGMPATESARMLEQAEGLLRKAISDAEHSGLAGETMYPRFRLGSIQEMRGDGAAAMETYRQLESTDPKFTDVRVALMKLYMMAKPEPREAEARQEALAILSERPNEAAYLTLGDLALNSGSFDDAITQYKKAVEKFPDLELAKRGMGVALLKKGEKAQALAKFREALVQCKYQFSELRVITLALVMSSDHAEALQVLEEAKGKTNEAGGAEFLKGEVESDRRDIEKACEYYEAAVKAAPSNIAFKVALGRASVVRKNYVRAEQLGEDVLKNNESGPEAGRGYELLLAVCQAQKDNDKADKVFQRWLKASPNDVAGVNNYAYFLTDQGKPQQALRLMTDLQGNAKDKEEYQQYLPQLLDTEGWARFKLGDAAQARLALEKARELRPRSPDVLNHLRIVYTELQQQALKQGDQAMAKRYEEEAIKASRGLHETQWADPEMQVNLARVLVMEGKLEEAAARLKQVSQLTGDLRARKALTETLLKAGRLDEAATEMVTLKKDAPDDVMVSALEAMLLMQRADTMMQTGTGTLAEAKALLGQGEVILAKALKKAPDAGMAHYVQSQMFMRDRKWAEASKELDETVRLMPEFVDGYMMRADLYAGQGRLDEAVKACMEVLKRSPRDYGAHLELGNLLLAQNKMEEAEQRFRVMVDVFQDVAGAHERLGFVLMRQNKMDEAITEYKTALTKMPGEVKLLQPLATLYLRTGKSAQALAAVKAFLDQNRTSVQGQVLLGQLYDQMNQPVDAEDALNKAVEFGPQDASGYVALWNHYMARQQFALAKAQADKMVDGKVGLAKGWWMRAQSYQGLKEWDKAQEAYRSGLGVNPEDVGMSNDLAWMLLDNMGKTDEAIKVAEAAKKVKGDYWPLLDTLGYAYFVKGDYAKATDNLDQATTLMKADNTVAPEVLLHLGMALIKGGQTEAGKEKVNEAVQRAPNLRIPDWVKEAMQKKP